MPVPYAKPYLDVAGQLAQLQARGMAITDQAAAQTYLTRIGYYRLSGYWYPFRQSQQSVDASGRPFTQILDNFRAGTEFRHVIDLYVFDKRLRLILLDAIERIEVAIRVDIALALGQKSPWAHRDPTLLAHHFKTLKPGHLKTQHDKWISRLDDIEGRSKEEFAQHFRAKYSSELPIWMSIELWDFGMLSTFFAGMHNTDQLPIARKYGVANPQILSTWLRSINYIRNVCAHHSRLWNLAVVDQPKLSPRGSIVTLNHLYTTTNATFRIYAIIAILQYFMTKINPTSTWRQRLAEHIDAFPAVPVVSMQNAGFPANWKNEALWR